MTLPTDGWKRTSVAIRSDNFDRLTALLAATGFKSVSELLNTLAENDSAETVTLLKPYSDLANKAKNQKQAITALARRLRTISDPNVLDAVTALLDGPQGVA